MMSILIIYICYLNNQYSFIKSIFLYNIRKFNHLFDWVLNFTGSTSGCNHFRLYHFTIRTKKAMNTWSFNTLLQLHLFSPSVRTLISFSLYFCLLFSIFLDRSAYIITFTRLVFISSSFFQSTCTVK